MILRYDLFFHTYTRIQTPCITRSQLVQRNAAPPCRPSLRDLPRPAHPRVPFRCARAPRASYCRCRSLGIPAPDSIYRRLAGPTETTELIDLYGLGKFRWHMKQGA